VINVLNRGGAGRLPDPTADHQPPPFYDVNGDHFVSPIDALLVINYLNARGNGEGDGEGEGEAASVVFTQPSVFLPWVGGHRTANAQPVSPGAGRALHIPGLEDKPPLLLTGFPSSGSAHEARFRTNTPGKRTDADLEEIIADVATGTVRFRRDQL